MLVLLSARLSASWLVEGLGKWSSDSWLAVGWDLSSAHVLDQLCYLQAE